MQLDFSKSKIYKIVNNVNDECYVGSTTQSLNRRFSGHRGDYRQYKKGRGSNTTSFKMFDNYGVDNCRIELIENFPVKTRQELFARERVWIEKLNTVNKVIPTQTAQEYYKKNMDRIFAYKQEYNKKYSIRAQNELYDYRHQRLSYYYEDMLNWSSKYDKELHEVVCKHLHKMKLNDLSLKVGGNSFWIKQGKVMNNKVKCGDLNN